MSVLDWIKENEVILGWLGGLGLLVFIGSLITIPLIVAYMPEDYFLRIERGPLPRRPLRQLGHVLKNLLGVLLFMAGFLMLLLPGQGILTMVIGLSLVDFPGKRHLQVRLVQSSRVQQPIAWIRHKSGRPPLIIPEHGPPPAQADADGR